MKLIWNGDEVTSTISDIIVRDNAGGIADTLAVIFPDPELTWLNWQPKKGDTISVEDTGWSSGAMFFDGFAARAGQYQALAISTPPQGKSEAHRAWQGALFSHIAGDIAAACGLALELHGITDYRYDSVTQDGEANLGFLNRLCAREGWMLKVHDRKAIVFVEKEMESAAAVLTLDRRDLGNDYEFGSGSTALKSQCRVRHAGAGGTVEYALSAAGVYGGTLQIDWGAASVSEAQRFARAALRASNRDEYAGKFSLPLNRDISAGNVIALTGMGALSGTWYLTRVEQRLISGVTMCRCRRPIEGEY